MAEEKPNKPSSGADEQSRSKASRAYVNQTDVPRHSLGEALRIPQAICDNYGKAPTKPFNIASALELSPSSTMFRMLCGASAAYGLTQGSYSSDMVSLTELGRRIVAPTAEGSELPARREALLKPRVIKEFLTKYNNSKVPSDKIARNVLEEMGVPVDATERTFGLILKSAKEVGFLRELKGSVYVDLDSVAAPSNAAEDEPSNQPSPGFKLDDDISGDGRSNGANSSSVESSPMNNRVFITHGKNKEIVTQLRSC